MDIRELEPVFKLLNDQEERLSDKIGEVHNTIKSVDKKVGIQNGRVTTLEKCYNSVHLNCKNTSNNIDRKFKEITPSVRFIKSVNIVLKHPAKSLIGFVVFLFGSEMFVLWLFMKGYLWEIIKKFI